MANKLLVGVSGGPDSMYLLYKLYKKNKDLVVAHVNYSLREDSSKDEKLVRSFCKNNNIKFYSKKIKTKPTGNTQSWARELRFNFFFEICKKEQINEIYLGHHKNDFIETAIMQSERSNELNFYGIKKEIKFGEIKVKRPLLKMYKDEILNKVNKNDIPFVVDSSNEKEIYTRNKVRKNLSLKSKKELNEIYKHFLSINKSNEKLNRKIEKTYQEWSETNFSIMFFNTMDMEIKKHIIYTFLIRKNLNININSNKINAVIEFLEKKSKGKYRISEDIFLKLVKGKLELTWEQKKK